MPVVIADSFTAPDGTLLKNHLPEIGGAWTDKPTIDNVKIYGNRARFQWRNSSNTVTNASVSTGLNCYAQAKLYNLAALDYIFELDINFFSVWVYDFLNISWEDTVWRFYLNSINMVHTPIEGATYRIERKGDTVHAYENGIEIMSAPALGTGNKFRFLMYHQAEIDDYEAGTVAVPAALVQHLTVVGVG